jgi:hypothetical protein
MRIVLSSFGTLGDIHPLIALSLELRRRGHHPVLAVPEIFRSKILPLDLEFFPVGPMISPEDSQRVAALMDIHSGTERTLREVLFPALRQSYDELLRAVQAQGGADLLVAGELSYQAPIVAEMTGIPWASYVLAPLSFFSRYDAPVLPPYPALAHMQRVVPGIGFVIASFARWVTRNWPEPVYRLRAELGLTKGKDPIFEAKHSPSLVLAMFSPLLGRPQPDWPSATRITGFVFYDGDHHPWFSRLVPSLCWMRETFLQRAHWLPKNSGSAPFFLSEANREITLRTCLTLSVLPNTRLIRDCFPGHPSSSIRVGLAPLPRLYVPESPC